MRVHESTDLLNTNLTDRDSAVESLLDRYYNASDTAAGDIEEELLLYAHAVIQNKMRREFTRAEEIQDEYANARFRLLKALRRNRASKRHTAFWALTNVVIRSTVMDAKRPLDPRCIMRLKLKYLLTNARYALRFAQWEWQQALLIGLADWVGRPFIYTSAYNAFCMDDTMFVQQALGGRHPAASRQAPLPELLEALLRWVETPLIERDLITHLLDLTAAPKTSVHLFTDLAVVQEREDIQESLPSSPGPPESGMDWEGCWLAVQSLPVNARRVVLLAWSRDMLYELIGQSAPCPLLAQTLQYSLETTQKLWKRLPMNDKEMAGDEELGDLYGKSVASVQTMRCRALDTLRKRWKDFHTG